MLNNYRVIIHYDGTNYSGWQFQAPPTRTIQGEMVRVLKIIGKDYVVVTGSSRTDAGVHSTGLCANFHLKIRIAPESLTKALNALLPEDIRIMDCQEADKSFNARFGAQQKIYVYKLFFGQTISPFDCRFMAHVPYPLNLRQMRKSIRHFVGVKDFSSFTSDEPEKNRIREISEFTMKVSGEVITFSIRGKSFLRYMVRNMVGSVIDVGRGKLQEKDLPEIFAAKDRRKAGQTAPARGLTLAKVFYGDAPPTAVAPAEAELS